jgi:hypothetical protein
MMYAAMGTRPDISFAVSHLSQFSANPGPAHWTQAQSVITYLYTTRDVELVLGGKEISLSGWVDSDWASDRGDRRSIAGYMYSLGGGPISWSSKKQPTVATSSVEAEYMACAYGIKEALWLRSLLKLMGFEQKTATSILCDNMGAIILTKDPTFHARTKHIDVAHHFIRERVAHGEVSFTHVPTRENSADILTKALNRPVFSYLFNKIGLRRAKVAVTA